MKRSTKILELFIAVLLVTSTFYSFDTNFKKDKEGDPERGEYLSTIIGCDHCHAPKTMTPQGPKPIMDRWMSGYPDTRELADFNKSVVTPTGWGLHTADLTAFVGPWGVSFGANLTPDETGIGNWTFENFKKAMTEGKYKGLDNSRPMLPPMPWPSYQNMEEQDLRDIFAYLKSLPPVRNKVPAFIPTDKI